jgi:hypothetical protein
MNYLRTFATISAACLLMGCMGTSDSSETTSEPSVGEASAAFQLYNVRSGPGFQFPIVYQIPPGTALNILCYTLDPIGNRWYQLGDGNYILASLMPWGNYPMCFGAGIQPGVGAPPPGAGYRPPPR